MKLKALTAIAGLALMSGLVTAPATASETAPVSEVTASTPEPVTASSDVVLTSEEPAVSTEPAPQPEPVPEPVQEPVVTPQPEPAPEPAPAPVVPAEDTTAPVEPAPVEPAPEPAPEPEPASINEARNLFDFRLAYHLSTTEQERVFTESYLGHILMTDTPPAYTVVVQSAINPAYKYVFDLKPYDCTPEDAPEDGTEWAKCFEHDLKLS